MDDSLKCPHSLLADLAELRQCVSALGDSAMRALEEQQQHCREEQRLLRELLKRYESHRQWAAGEIHDAIAQPLTAALMNYEGAVEQLRRAGPDAAREVLERLRDTLRKSLSGARRLMCGLRPPMLDDFGIVAAVEYLVQETRIETGLDLSWRAEVEFQRLSCELETALFRMVQEGLANIRQHSGSDRAAVELLQQGPRLTLTIHDWGLGFDPRAVRPGFGLDAIRQWAELLGGEARIESAPGRGTRIRVYLPLSGQGEEAD